MIALQVILLVTTVVGVLISYIEFRRSQNMYGSVRDGGDNGLTLQVASHQVRISVTNLVTHTVQVVVAGIVLAVMWSHRDGWDLTLVMMTGLTMVATLTMLKQLMYRYDRALLMDTAMVTIRQKNSTETQK